MDRYLSKISYLRIWVCLTVFLCSIFVCELGLSAKKSSLVVGKANPKKTAFAVRHEYRKRTGFRWEEASNQEQKDFMFVLHVEDVKKSMKEGHKQIRKLKSDMKHFRQKSAFKNKIARKRIKEGIRDIEDKRVVERKKRLLNTAMVQSSVDRQIKRIKSQRNH